MTSKCGNFSKTWPLHTALVLTSLVTLSSSAFANGKAHNPDGEMTEHMQSMMAVKEDIPEEYRIMNRTPVTPDESSLQQGGELFLENCSVCHGEKGDGKGPASKAMKVPPANFLEKKHSKIYGPGEKYWLIGNGTGKTGMPAFTHLTPAQRWHLVNYIFLLQKEEKANQ